MRTQVTKSGNYGVAKKMRVKRNSVVFFTDEEKIEILIPDGIPEGLTLPPAGTELLDVTYSMNGPSDMLYGYGPAKGAHVVKFARFSSKRDELPAPRVLEGGPRTGKDGRKWFQDPKLVFTALLEVLTGDFKGCSIPYMMDYAFQKDLSTGTTYIKAGQKTLAKITNFLELAGIDIANEEIPYSDNILPDLEMVLSDRSEDAVFQVMMKDGWPDELSELPAGFNPFKKRKAVEPEPEEDDEDLEEEDDEEIEIPVKKAAPAKKATVVVEDDDEDDEPVVKTKKAAAPVAKKSSTRQSWNTPVDEDETPF